MPALPRDRCTALRVDPANHSLRCHPLELLPDDNQNSRLVAAGLAFGVYFFLPTAAVWATTKGLSQIVTPDVQPEGGLSLSFQWQSKQIANPYQFQSEWGSLSGLRSHYAIH
jgi:hypothetical protein